MSLFIYFYYLLYQPKHKNTTNKWNGYLVLTLRRKCLEVEFYTMQILLNLRENLIVLRCL